MPALAVTGFLGFIAGWTEFYFSWMFLNKVEDQTLAMALNAMQGQFASTPVVAVLGVRDPVRDPAGDRLLLLPAYITSRPRGRRRQGLTSTTRSSWAARSPRTQASKPPAALTAGAGTVASPERGPSAGGVPHNGPLGKVSVTPVDGRVGQVRDDRDGVAGRRIVTEVGVHGRRRRLDRDEVAGRAARDAPPGGR